jgi:hypothetical protein
MTFKLSDGNSKLNILARHMGYKLAHVLTCDVPAGFTCSKANICKTYANRKTGKLQRVGRVACYASVQEGYLPSVRKFRWNNYFALLACGTNVLEIAAVIESAILPKHKVIRVHSSGDFYSFEYFQAWCLVAERHPEMKFFGYTKHLDYVKYNRPENFQFVYSWGSDDDGRYIEEGCNYSNTPTCFIEEYDNQWEGLNIPHVCGTHEEGWQDYEKIMEGESFIIRIH